MPKETSSMFVHFFQEGFLQKKQRHEVEGKARQAGINKGKSAT
jgi:hypothetical protein